MKRNLQVEKPKVRAAAAPQVALDVRAAAAALLAAAAALMALAHAL
jgi:hypothetical protein